MKGTEKPGYWQGSCVMHKHHFPLMQHLVRAYMLLVSHVTVDCKLDRSIASFAFQDAFFWQNLTVW